MTHHTLKVGTLVSIGGMNGRIRRLNPDRRISNSTELGEWYDVQVYVDKSGKLWKCERRYLKVR